MSRGRSKHRNKDRLDRRFTERQDEKFERTYWQSRKWAMSRRCQWCGDPVVLVWQTKRQKREKGDYTKRIPVEARTWDGSIFYIPGLHRHHHCEGALAYLARKKARRAKEAAAPKHAGVDPDFIV